MKMIHHSPNSCLQHGVLAVNLTNSLAPTGLASRWRPSFLSHVVSAVHILDSALFRMLLWPPGNSQKRTAPFVSKSQVSQNLAVVPAILKMRNCAISLRPLLSSKSFKNDSNYKHYWSPWFLSWSLSIDFSSKTPVIISILGVPDFWLDRLILRIFIFPKEILKFWSVDAFDDFVSLS